MKLRFFYLWSYVCFAFFHVVVFSGCSPNEDAAYQEAIKSDNIALAVEFVKRFPNSPRQVEVSAHCDMLVSTEADDVFLKLATTHDHFQAFQRLKSILDAGVTNAVVLNNYAVLLAQKTVQSNELAYAASLLEGAKRIAYSNGIPDVVLTVYKTNLHLPDDMPNTLNLFMPTTAPRKKAVLDVVAEYEPKKRYLVFQGETFLQPLAWRGGSHTRLDQSEDYLLATEIDANLATLNRWTVNTNLRR